MVLHLDVLSSSGTRILLEYLAMYVQRAGITMIAPEIRRVNQKNVIPDNNSHWIITICYFREKLLTDNENQK